MTEGLLGNQEHSCLLHPWTSANLQNILRVTYHLQVCKATKETTAEVWNGRSDTDELILGVTVYYSSTQRGLWVGGWVWSWFVSFCFLGFKSWSDPQELSVIHERIWYVFAILGWRTQLDSRESNSTQSKKVLSPSKRKRPGTKLWRLPWKEQINAVKVTVSEGWQSTDRRSKNMKGESSLKRSCRKRYWSRKRDFKEGSVPQTLSYCYDFGQ